MVSVTPSSLEKRNTRLEHTRQLSPPFVAPCLNPAVAPEGHQKAEIAAKRAVKKVRLAGLVSVEVEEVVMEVALVVTPPMHRIFPMHPPWIRPSLARTNRKWRAKSMK